MKPQRAELILLMVACLMAAVIGGQVNVDPMPFAGFGSALTGQAESTSITRFLIGLPIFAALGLIFFRNRVIHFGRTLVFAPLLILVAFMCASPLFSEFPEQSKEAAVSWLIYGAAFALGTAAVGRRQGVWMLAGAIGGGAAIVSAKGIFEFAMIRAVDPTYRIFAGWGNPNSLASMLVIAIPLTLGLCIKLERPYKFIALGASSLQFIALLLTQSKGGFLAAGVSLVVFVALTLIWHRKKEAAIAIAPPIVAALFMAALVASPASESGAAPLTRLASSQEMQEQSSGVRTLLWKSAAELIQQKPGGYGAGTFRFHSAQPGLVEQTVFAHQSFLETGVEGGVVALLALLATGIAWFWLMFAGSRSQTSEQKLLKAAIIASVVAWGAHSMLESTLSTFGIGVLIFAILGAGLQTAADGSSPELLPRGMRLSIAAVVIGFGLVGSAIFARTESSKSAVLTAALNRDVAQMETALAALPEGGESAYLRSLYEAQSEEERYEYLQEAAETFPTTRTLRALASSAMRLENQSAAEAALMRALEYDPNNLSTYQLLVEVYDHFDMEEQAIETAKKAIALESESSFQTRALAEVVPTQTYEIRIWLAQRTDDDREKIKLLQDALDGFVRYRELTVPQIQRFAAEDMPFLGETMDSARAKLTAAADAGQELVELYSEAGNEEAAAAAREAVESLSLDSD